MSEVPVSPAAPVPGKTLGIVGLILAIVPGTQVIGLILSIVGKVQSKNAGVKNTPATAGIIVSIIFIVIGIIIAIVSFAAAGAIIAEACAGLESGTYTDGTTTVTCP